MSTHRATAHHLSRRLFQRPALLSVLQLVYDVRRRQLRLQVQVDRHPRARTLCPLPNQLPADRLENDVRLRVQLDPTGQSRVATASKLRTGDPTRPDLAKSLNW